jgi:cytochrome b pre-mRNA-processing protein 3
VRLLKNLFGGSPHREAAHALYAAAVRQARLPLFFQRWGVPDTVEGRFDMIVLHVHAVMRRLKGQGKDADALSQELFDVMFDDMDQNLRELGVSDIRIGRRIKDLAASFYGRIAAYDAALLPDAETGALEGALRRNVYLDDEDGDAAALAVYVRAMYDDMVRAPLDDLMAGRPPFPAPETPEPA